MGESNTSKSNKETDFIARVVALNNNILDFFFAKCFFCLPVHSAKSFHKFELRDVAVATGTAARFEI